MNAHPADDCTSHHIPIYPVGTVRRRQDSASLSGLLAKLGWILILAAVVRVGAEAPPEPRLFRSVLRIEPTLEQVATMPPMAAEWRIAPGTVVRWDEVMVAAGISEALAAELRKRLVVSSETGDGTIVPDAALLDRFEPAERARWWAVLSGHPANRTYRWPVAIRATELAAMEQEAGFTEAVQRVRRWGITAGPRVLFGDLFALAGAFRNDATRQAFLQQLFSAETIFAKLVADTADPESVAANAAYWKAGDQSTELEPILSAIGRIDGHDRIDLAHLLPRLTRSLLYTYPPDFAVVKDPSVENAAMAVGYFTPNADPNPMLADGFSDWLRTNCDPVAAPSREYGDIIVFEDSTRTRWPFALVYMADGIVFGRRPTLYGPWELLPEAAIPDLNPRLRGQMATVWRRRSPPGNAGPRTDPVSWVPPEWPQSPVLRELPPGPWGRLWCYDVLLAPSSGMLDNLPVPDGHPKWVFHGTDRGEFERTIATVPMPEGTRRGLLALFEGVRPDRRGMVVVEPTPELVLATPAGFREKHFGRLSHGAFATDYAQDVHIAARAGAARWFSPELLPEPARAVVLSLVYSHGGGLMLSDYGTLYHAVPDPQVRRQTLRALYRTPALILLLERPRPDEIPGLVDYWRMDQEKSIGRLLESFAGTEELAYLDVVHLLPPLAREMMNVYIRADANGPIPSCYWTALNFSAEQPDSRLLVTSSAPDGEDKAARQKLKTEYMRVGTAGRLGDVIAYRRKTDDYLLHLCAYVAADIVYTKNGYGFSSPWCLMRLSDVDSLYADDGTVERLVYRLRPVPPVN